MLLNARCAFIKTISCDLIENKRVDVAYIELWMSEDEVPLPETAWVSVESPLL